MCHCFYIFGLKIWILINTFCDIINARKLFILKTRISISNFGQLSSKFTKGQLKLSEMDHTLPSHLERLFRINTQFLSRNLSLNSFCVRSHNSNVYKKCLYENKNYSNHWVTALKKLIYYDDLFTKYLYIFLFAIFKYIIYNNNIFRWLKISYFK